MFINLKENEVAFAVTLLLYNQHNKRKIYQIINAMLIKI